MTSIQGRIYVHICTYIYTSERCLTQERRHITEGTAEVPVSINAAETIPRKQIEIKYERWRAEGAAVKKKKAAERVFVSGAHRRSGVITAFFSNLCCFQWRLLVRKQLVRCLHGRAKHKPADAVAVLATSRC